MIKTFLIILTSLLCSPLFSQTPAIKWWFDTKDASFGQTAAGDIDKDGKLELVFGCYRNDSCIYALNAENGSLLWKYNTHTKYAEGCNDVAPIIFDINNDDSLEVIAPSSCNPKTYCFNGKTGKIIWQTDTRGSDSPPTIADIDGDGKAEILHGEFGGYVICLNSEDGSIAWEIAVDLNSWIQTAPTICDLDGDKKPDFVVATWNAVQGDTNKVYAFRGYDQKLLWTFPLNDVVYHGTAIADLDKDGKPELVIGDYSGTLFCLNGENGSLKWKYECPQYFYVGSPTSIADLDDDGHCEIIFSAWYKIYVLSDSGTLKWEYDMPGYGSSFRGVALADIDNDSRPDVVFGTSDGFLIALKGTNKQLLWQINLAEHYGDTFELDHAPVIADFDNDGVREAFIVGGFTKYPDTYRNYGRAYCVEAGTGSGPEWLMFQHDLHRTSSLCPMVTSVNNFETDLKKTYRIFLSGNKYFIKINTDDKSFISMIDLQGRVMISQDIHENEMIELPEIKSGLYLLKMIIQGQTLIDKIIIPQ